MANVRYVIEPAPATNGTNVRTIGTQRPSTTALPPYLSKNACACARCFRLSSLCTSPASSVEEKTLGPT